ncbi:MAG: hypothetical protein AB1847_17870 [bacterium]
MRKATPLLALSLVLVIALCSCNSSKKPDASVDSEMGNASEMEKKLVGKWKFLNTDAIQEKVPEDLTYTLHADHTCMLEFTGEKSEKMQIPGTYKVVEDRIQFFRDGNLRKVFQVQFHGNDTIRFTEPKSKNSLTMARSTETAETGGE